MKPLATTALLMAALGLQTSFAQLSGTYTVGGDSPDFATFQDAADSLMLAGVIGSVNVLARPGVYTEADGSLRVLDLAADIPGTSAFARVRFAPDRASGATNTNVVLRRSSGTREDGFVVRLKSSHTTIEGLTVELSDTTAAVAEIPSLVYLEAVADAGVQGMIVDGLGGRRAWRCILLRDIREDVFVRDNQISACVEPIYQINYGPGIPADRLAITGNHATGMSILPEKRDPEYGLLLRLDGGAIDVVVADNVFDYRAASGINGIGITGAAPKPGLRVERNEVLGLDSNYFPFEWGQLLRVDDAPGGVIANNFLSGNSSRGSGVYLTMGQWSDTLTFAHNTVRLGGGTCGALQVSRDDRFPTYLRVLDNILISEGSCANFTYQHMAFQSTTPSNATLDYNVHFTLAPLAFDNIGGYYVDLVAWQGAGFGEHSLVDRVEFVDDQSDLHLGECAFEDESLRGIALPLVTVDFDSEGRDLQFPFIGADEPSDIPPPLFDGPTLSNGANGPRHMASGDLDGDGDVDVVVTNPGSSASGLGDNEVTVHWNDGTGRFPTFDRLTFGNDPDPIVVGMINSDDVPDLVVSNTEGIIVRFGLGAGGFSPPIQVSNFATSDLELADYDNDGDVDIFALSAPPTDSATVVVTINQGDGTFSQFNDFRKVTLYASDMELGDLDDDGYVDVLVVDAVSSGQLFTLSNLGTQTPGISNGFGTPVAYAFGLSSVSSRSRFVVGDFDSDLDADIVLGELGFDGLVLVRNNGDGTLSAPEAFDVHRRGVPEVVTALDYEGDGDLDLVSASNLETVDLLLNDGQGSFERLVLCSDGRLSGFPLEIISAPLNGDSSADVGVLTFTPAITGVIEVLSNLEWSPSGVAVEDPSDLPSEESRLYPNYPNPFSHVTSVRFELTESSPVRLDVFDLLGRRVTTVLDEIRPPGEHSVQFDARELASGIYLYRLAAKEFVETRRMVVVR